MTVSFAKTTQPIQLIDRFREISSRDSRVLAAFLGGSLAEGKGDAYSDLDLYLITSNEDYPAFYANRRKFFDQWSEAVFLEDFNDFGFDMLIFILETGTQGELAMSPVENFRSIHAGPYQVLVDKPGMLSGVEFLIEHPNQEQQVEAIRRNVHWFWRELSLASVALHRNQRWTAHSYLENARQRFANLVRLRRDINGWPAGYEKIEIAVPQGLEEFEPAFATLSRQSMISATQFLIERYKAVARPLCEKYNLTYPVELEKVVENTWHDLRP